MNNSEHPSLVDISIDSKLAEDIEISRREFAEGKGIPHAQVMREMEEMLLRRANRKASV